MFLLDEQKLMREFAAEVSLEGDSGKQKERNIKLGKIFTQSLQQQLAIIDGNKSNIKTLSDLAAKNGALGTKLIQNNIEGFLLCLIGIHYINFFCIITYKNLIEKDKAEEFINTITNEFYEDPKQMSFITNELSFLIFETAPSTGVVMVDPKYEIWYD